MAPFQTQSLALRWAKLWNLYRQRQAGSGAAKPGKEEFRFIGMRCVPVFCSGISIFTDLKKEAGLNTSAPRRRNTSTWCEAPGYNTPIPQVLKGRNISIPHSAVTRSSISPFQGLLVFFYHSGRCPELCYNSPSGNHLFSLISSLVTVCPGMLGDLHRQKLIFVKPNPDYALATNLTPSVCDKLFMTPP